MANKTIPPEKAFNDYIEHVKRYKNHSLDKLNKMTNFFDKLLIDCESHPIKNLNHYSVREPLYDYANDIVRLSKKDYEKPATTQIERAKFYNGFVDYYSDNIYGNKKSLKQVNMELLTKRLLT